MLQRERGFTLIELLIVVAIIGIIAAIAVPNLLTAINRSKRSRTAADMRSIGTALGAYQVDFNFYPRAAGTMTGSAADYGIGLPRIFYEGAARDAWGMGFVYTVDATGSQYTLTSTGRDIAPGCMAGSEFNSDIVFSNGLFKAPDFLVKR